MMSKLSVMEQLHSEWLSAHTVWERAQKEVNEAMLQFCLGKGRAPTRKRLDAVALLLQEMCEARTQLDNFMREYTSAPKSSRESLNPLPVSNDFIEAARTAQS